MTNIAFEFGATIDKYIGDAWSFSAIPNRKA
jgi:hypothetical protein